VSPDTAVGRAAGGASMLCVRFPPKAPEGATALLAFEELGHVAVAEAIGADAAAPTDGFLVVHLPGGNSAPAATRAAAEAWIAGAGLLDLTLQSERILWRPGHALVIGGSGDFDAYLKGLASFALYESELRRLEQDLLAWWPLAQKDVPLTHRVDGRALHRWRHVARMTEAVTDARFRHVAIEACLERAPEPLEGLARRLFTELALRIDATHRLERLDDRIDVLADLYELANDRLSEFSYFRREYLLEFLIIGVLALEVLLLLYEIL
jgi:hypothetical protein